MKVFGQHKETVLVAVLLVVILIVALFIFQNASKPSATPTSSPFPTATSSPFPTEISPKPSQTPTPTPSSSLYPGEVTQYQNQSLTPIRAFINELVQHPDVSIKGIQYINQTTYRLTVSGLVNKTMMYTYGNVVNNFQLNQKVATLLCVEGWSVTMLWQGVLVNDLLQDAGVSPNATTIIFSASDGYTT